MIGTLILIAVVVSVITAVVLFALLQITKAIKKLSKQIGKTFFKTVLWFICSPFKAFKYVRELKKNRKLKATASIYTEAVMRAHERYIVEVLAEQLPEIATDREVIAKREYKNTVEEFYKSQAKLKAYSKKKSFKK